MRLAEAARLQRLRLIMMAAVRAIAALLATTTAWMITSFRPASTTLSGPLPHLVTVAMATADQVLADQLSTS